MAVRNPVQQIAAAHKRVSLAQVAKFSKVLAITAVPTCGLANLAVRHTTAL